MNWLDVVVLALLVVGVFFAIRYLRQHGNPCGGCQGDCSQCGKHKRD